MFVTLTVKAEAESKDELISGFVPQIQVLRQHFNELLKEGCFGPVEKCAIRYLIIGGKTGDESKLDHMRGTPDVE